MLNIITFIFLSYYWLLLSFSYYFRVLLKGDLQSFVNRLFLKSFNTTLIKKILKNYQKKWMLFVFSHKKFINQWSHAFINFFHNFIGNLEHHYGLIMCLKIYVIPQVNYINHGDFWHWQLMKTKPCFSKICIMRRNVHIAWLGG